MKKEIIFADLFYGLVSIRVADFRHPR